MNNFQTTIHTDREQVEFFFSCSNLQNKDILSKSDPQVLLYQTNPQNQKSLLHKTEIIKDNLNPEFNSSLTLDYIFETHQYFFAEVIDIDNSSGTNFDMIGSVNFKMTDIMTTRERCAVLQLTNKGKKTGELIIQAEIVSSENYDLRMKFLGLDLKNFGFLSRINPIIKFYKYQLVSKNPEAIENAISEATKFAGPQILRTKKWNCVYVTEIGHKSQEVHKFIEIFTNSSKFCSSLFKLPLKVNFSLISAFYTIITKMEIINTKANLISPSKTLNLDKPSNSKIQLNKEPQEISDLNIFIKHENFNF